MKQEQVWREFSALPPTAQQLVMDFIELLRKKYVAVVKEKPNNSLSSLNDEPFVGMWCERSELNDSIDYVRDLRSREWGSRGE